MLHEKIRKKVSILARFKLLEDNELKKVVNLYYVLGC